MNDTRVEKVANGYIVTRGSETRIAATLNDVFDDMLSSFEGRAKTFSDSGYGEVLIYRCKCHLTENSCCDKCQYPMRNPPFVDDAKPEVTQ